MLISKEVQIKLGKKNHTFLKKKYNLNKDLMPGEIVNVPITILNKSSHFLVDVSCDYCFIELKVPYKRFNLNTKVVNKYACSNKECSNKKIKDVCSIKYGVDNPFQANFVKDKIKDTLFKKHGVTHQMFLKETKDKIKDTCMKTYGFESPLKSDIVKDKIKETCINKYGVDHHSKTKEGQLSRKISRILKGNQVPDELVTEYRKYRLSVNRITGVLKSKIIKDWDGYDYYDGEYIKDNFRLPTNDRCFPHFDHKISVIYGFYNKIDPEIIGAIENLCITKQWINGLKKEKCEFEFIKEFKKAK